MLPGEKVVCGLLARHVVFKGIEPSTGPVQQGVGHVDPIRHDVPASDTPHLTPHPQIHECVEDMDVAQQHIH